MKRVFKKFFSNPWTIAIIPPLILAIITPLWISWWKNMNLSESINFITEKLWNIFNYKLPLWLILIVVVFLIISLIVIDRLLNSLGNNENPSKTNYPDWYYNFKEMNFKEWLFVWDYRLTLNGSLEIVDLKPICTCRCDLLKKSRIGNTYYGTSVLQCPNCKKVYKNPTIDDLKELDCILRFKIKNL
ncbi:TPA: hypothetical protein I9065_003009 [Clostridium perfringens]|nr:hypothetical protein [Clostridium perfringens]